jgi:DNA-binding NtrC family response regulator
MIKILIIDDQSTIRASLSYLLRRFATVIQSESLKEAQNALSKDNFDLVISDLRLTGTDGKEGLEILRHVRQTSPETKVIIMTGYGNDAVRKEAYDLGAMHFYEKPLDMAQLLLQVQSLKD